MMSLESFHAKRKEPDDLVADLLRNVSISPTKKVRIGDSWVPSNIWQSPLSGPSKETLVHSPISAEAPVSPPAPPIVPSTPAPPVVTPPPVPTVVSRAEEKALVLYRPLNPPLYPGGPPTGSSELPIRVHAAGYLAAIKGTDNNGLCSDAGHPSSAFANSSDALCGAGLFEALDLQGGPSSAFSSKRLQRVSSCSSLPRAATSLDNLPMEDDSDPQISNGGNQMALIPWAPPAFPPPPDVNNNLSPSESGMMTTPMDNIDTHSGDEEEMIDIEPMEVMEDVANGEVVVPAEPASQFGSPIPTFGSSQWGTSKSLKPPYSKVMWSH